MNILIANDDGIEAKGLKALVSAVEKDHNVYICAPSTQQSAKSHSITMNRPIMVREVPWSGSVVAAYAVSGTPADCVKIAIEELYTEVDFDLILSGINHGPNLGHDIIYSGTVAAAVEGTFYGIKAVAVSLHSHEGTYFETAAQFVASHINVFKELDLGKDTALNVNVPNLPQEKIKGIRKTFLGERKYTNTFETRTAPRGQTYYWLAGDPVSTSQNEYADVIAIEKGFISLTPVRFDFSANEGMIALEKAFGNLLK